MVQVLNSNLASALGPFLLPLNRREELRALSCQIRNLPLTPTPSASSLFFLLGLGGSWCQGSGLSHLWKLLEGATCSYPVFSFLPQQTPSLSNTLICVFNLPSLGTYVCIVKRPCYPFNLPGKLVLSQQGSQILCSPQESWRAGLLTTIKIFPIISLERAHGTKEGQVGETRRMTSTSPTPTVF